MDSCNFTDNIANTSAGSDIFFEHRFLYKTFLLLKQSRFSNFYQKSVQITCVKLDAADLGIQIINSTFKKGARMDMFPTEIANPVLISAVRIDTCPQLFLDNVTFDGITGTMGSGLYLNDVNYDRTSSLTVKNSRFLNLRGWCGAALYINNVEYVSIINTLF